jgi:hypothetical protein
MPFTIFSKKSKWSSSRKYSKWYSSGKKGKWSLARNIVNGIHLEKKGKWSHLPFFPDEYHLLYF